MDHPSAQVSARILHSYTCDIARYDRRNAAEQRADLVELASRRRALWEHLLGYAPLREQVVTAIEAMEHGPASTGRKAEDTLELASALSMTPHNAELLEQMVQDLRLLQSGGIGGLRIAKSRRPQSHRRNPVSRLI